MEVDHAADLRRYAPQADEKHIKAVIKHLGIALKSNDSAMVACSSKEELDRVRESWLKKKLKLTAADADLDKSIKAVCETMKADKSKSRVAFYYLLAANHGKLAAL